MVGVCAVEGCGEEGVMRVVEVAHFPVVLEQ